MSPFRTSFLEPLSKRRALWASTTARGGMSTYVRTMQDTPLWRDWDIHFISTHAEKRKLLLWNFTIAFALFLRELVFRRPTVVHLHTAAYGSFARKATLAWLSKIFRVPVVMHIHAADFHTFFNAAPRWYKFLIRSTLVHMDSVVALGNAWADYISGVAPNANVVVVPNAIRCGSPVDQFARTKTKVVFIGEIGERKGAFALIQAWSNMLKNDPSISAELTMVGDGEVVQARHLVNTLQLDGTVVVHGWKSAAEVAELLDSSHILVLPSRDEGQPMAVLEAMARGMCIVASTVGGIPELLDNGGCGVMVKPDDINQLSAALRHAITDADLRSSLGSKAFLRVKSHFDLDLVAQNIDRLYHEVSGK